MDAGMQVALPILGVVAAAAATFYVKSFRDLEESEDGGFESSLSSRKRRARRKAEKEAKK
ncbi:hypothetical protein POPTR_006G021100v4 [Populus trichocarpa]|uniref:Uncharacterized protein n=1 Tax=Populus trichocarpa TaxID=3694 RepID=A0ACC0SRV9_POPTR|nr:hypothetical protein POPTR_006G021100v4 [Populus trichocarpa]